MVPYQYIQVIQHKLLLLEMTNSSLNVTLSISQWVNPYQISWSMFSVGMSTMHGIIVPLFPSLDIIN